MVVVFVKIAANRVFVSMNTGLVGCGQRSVAEVVLEVWGEQQ